MRHVNRILLGDVVYVSIFCPLCQCFCNGQLQDRRRCDITLPLIVFLHQHSLHFIAHVAQRSVINISYL